MQFRIDVVIRTPQGGDWLYAYMSDVAPEVEHTLVRRSINGDEFFRVVATMKTFDQSKLRGPIFCQLYVVPTRGF